MRKQAILSIVRLQLTLLLALAWLPTPALAQGAPVTFRPPASPEAAFIAQPQEIPLWRNGAPGALGTASADQPTLTYYPPVYETGTAVVIAPGGGYAFVATNHEGRQIANWLNSIGIAAFVLRYRVGPTYHYPIELEDVQRAIRQVRAQAMELRIEPDHIGIMGFSAGGHLAALAATHFDHGNPNATDPIDRLSCRPDFAVLGYAVILLEGPYAHQESVQSLLGNHPDPALLEELSANTQVTPHTPPTFLVSTGEDTTVPAENTVAFYVALRKAGVPVELHIFAKGTHGRGLTLGNPTNDVWRTLVENWFRANGLLARYELPPQTGSR